MKFYFYPQNCDDFKQAAVGNYVRTIIFDHEKGRIVNDFVRKVHKYWEQTCKNNIQSDHRIKALAHDNFQIYSWITKSEDDLCLPFFL